MMNVRPSVEELEQVVRDSASQARRLRSGYALSHDYGSGRLSADDLLLTIQMLYSAYHPLEQAYNLVKSQKLMLPDDLALTYSMIDHEIRNKAASLHWFVAGARSSDKPLIEYVNDVKALSPTYEAVRLSTMFVLNVLEGTRGNTLVQPSVAQDVILEKFPYGTIVEPKLHVGTPITPRELALASNLVNNAGRAMKRSKRGDTIIASIEFTDGHYHITTDDNGPGMSEETLPYVLDKSFSDSTNVGGKLIRKQVLGNGGLAIYTSRYGDGLTHEYNARRESLRVVSDRPSSGMSVELKLAA